MSCSGRSFGDPFVLEAQLDDFAVSLAAKGKGTGALSKASSELCMILIPVTVSLLLADGLWIPAILFVIISVLGLHSIFELGIAVWAGIAGAWWAVGLLIAQVLLLTVSVYAGVAHAKQTLRHEWPTLSPFLAYSYPLSSIVGALSLALIPWLEGTWLWIAGSTSGLGLAMRAVGMFGRLHPRWRQVEGPFMHLYALDAAREHNRADLENAEFDPVRALMVTLIAAFEGQPRPEDSARDLLNTSVLRHYPNGVSPPPREAVRLTVGHLVEKRFGPKEKSEYWRFMGFSAPAMTSSQTAECVDESVAEDPTEDGAQSLEDAPVCEQFPCDVTLHRIDESRTAWMALHAKSPHEREGACVTLSGTRSPEAIDALVQALGDQVPTVGAAASRTLGNLGAQELPYLIIVLNRQLELEEDNRGLWGPKGSRQYRLGCCWAIEAIRRAIAVADRSSPEDAETVRQEVARATRDLAAANDRPSTPDDVCFYLGLLLRDMRSRDQAT